MKGAWQKTLERLFSPESDRWLTTLRTGCGLQAILYVGSLRHDWVAMFSSRGAGPISRSVTEIILSGESRWIPRMGWIVDGASRLGLSEWFVLGAVAWLLAGAGFLLMLGLFCREAAILAAFLHMCAVKSSGSLTYGLDNVTTIGLFYIAIGPLPDRLALDHIWRRRRAKDPKLLGFFRRVIQLHLCIIYLFGGIAKCASPDWWTGVSLWRAMIRPPFDVVSPDLLVHFRWFFPAVGAGVCLLETGYPVFIWPRRTRPYWLCAIIAMHAGIGLLLGLYLFALAMIVLNVAAFGWWSGVTEMPSGQLLSTGSLESETIG